MIYDVDEQSLNNYVEWLDTKLRDFLIENDPNQKVSDAQVVIILNQICESLNLEMRIQRRAGEIWIKATFLKEEVIYFPLIHIIFTEIYSDVMQCPGSTKLILDHIMKVLEQKQSLLDSLKQ